MTDRRHTDEAALDLIHVLLSLEWHDGLLDQIADIVQATGREIPQEPEPEWVACDRCGRILTEAEADIGDICDECAIEAESRRETEADIRRDRANEFAEWHRRQP